MTRKYWKRIISAAVVICTVIFMCGITIREETIGSNTHYAGVSTEEKADDDIILENYTDFLDGMFDNCMLQGGYNVDLNDNIYYLDTDFKIPVAKEHLIFRATFGEHVDVDNTRKVGAYRLADGRVCYAPVDVDCRWASEQYASINGLPSYEEYIPSKEELLESYSRFVELAFNTEVINFDFSSYAKETYYKDITYYKDLRCSKKFLGDVELVEPRRCIAVLDNNYIQNYAILRTDGRIAFISFIDL